MHRFTRTDADGPGTVPDTEYAELTLAMRAGDDPGAVFDALLARGQIRLHATEAERAAGALAATAADAPPAARATVVVADTREQVAALNAAIRDRLVAAGQVDDTHVATTRRRAADRRRRPDRHPPQRPRPRRRQPRHLDRHRRRHARRRHACTVTGDGTARLSRRRTSCPPTTSASTSSSAYASTAHGAQGDTVTAAHLVIGEHTGAASAYVGMTRGREANTAHLVADDLDDAREQWIAVFGRDRADLGPAHAAELAAREAARYAHTAPLEVVLRRAAPSLDVRSRRPDPSG